LRTLSDKSGAAAENRRADAPTLARQLRGDLDSIALKALEKDRAQRYATPADLAADIGRYLRNEPVLARRAGAWYRTRKYIRRHRVAVGLAAVAAALLIAFAIVQTIELRQTQRARARADRVTQFMTGMFKVSDPGEARGNDIRAREILDKASRDIDTGLAKDPELQAQMMDVMGNVYESLGLYRQADALLDRSVQIRTRILGLANRDTLKSIHDLAQVRYEEGRDADAEKSARRAMEMGRKSLGPDDRDTLTSEIVLGTIVNDEGRYPEADKLHREAVELSRRKFGAEDALTLRAMKGLAIDLAYEGNYSEAETMFRGVLDGDRHRLGPDHPTVLGDMINLAATLQHEDKYEEATRLYNEMIAISRRVLGPDNPTP